MVLAKSDMGIAARYAELAVGVDGHDAIFTRIRDGWNRAHDGLLDITGQTRLLEKNPALEASIRLRLPYIEPLKLLQIELMKHHSAGETDPRIAEGIQLTIKAIAAEPQNNGDRKSDVTGKSVAGRVEHGGHRHIKKKKI